MTFSLKSILAASVLAFGLTSVAQAADVKLRSGEMLSDKPTFVVTYIEAAAGTADRVSALIKAHTAASKKKKGNMRFEGLQRIIRGNHFLILEAWASSEDRAANAGSAETIAFRNALEPHLYAPFDERPHVGLVAAKPGSIARGNSSTIYVVTHADIIPPEQFAPCKRQINPAGPCGNEMLIGIAKASRKHAGNMRFDVLTQSNRSNHMSVVEMWDSAASQAAHQVHADKKKFRNELSGIAPAGGVNSNAQFVPNMLTGSLWDERRFRLISN
ncbi:MAG: antibiotic biosynthesis monooxygenase [Proteobacteria bacterium]|nr:antibiotic biosynthesis monooxygenase [Pseudomonadota bacterium]